MDRRVVVAVAAVFLLAVYLLGSLGGPGGKREDYKTDPREACEELCTEKLVDGADLENGPCLSNNIAPGWVCDVAHSPRQEVDNDPANQCPAYGKAASHFVEVDSNCGFIREA